MTFIQRLSIKINLPLILVLLSLIIGRVLIAGQGYLDDSDEVDFYIAERAYDTLLNLDLKGVSEQLALTEGKPTEALSKMCVIPIHRFYASLIHSPLHSIKSLMIAGYYNIAISIFMLYVFYLILLNLKLSQQISLIGVFSLGVFINFNLYTRHLLCYDLGLLFQLLALYLLTLSDTESYRKYALAGFFSALGFTTYNGYFMFPVVLFAFMSISPFSAFYILFKRLASFVLAFLSVITFYECFFRISGNSFLISSYVLSSTIDQGSYSEGFSFIFKYLYSVEGIFGISVLVLCLVKAGSLICKSKLRYSPAEKLLLLSLFGYLLYGFAVFVLMKVVFYGRILHMYYPFMVLGALLLIRNIKFIQSKYFLAFIAVVLTAQYICNIESLNSITYPRKVMNDFGLADNSNPKINLHFESELIFAENQLIKDELKLLPTRLAEGNYDILNACFFRHGANNIFMRTYQPYNNTNGQKIFSKKHFMSYPAYTFEYCSALGREFYTKKAFHIEIIKH